MAELLADTAFIGARHQERGQEAGDGRKPSKKGVGDAAAKSTSAAIYFSAYTAPHIVPTLRTTGRATTTHHS